MEAFQAPLREIQNRFTKSEIVIMGWRSAEQAYKMRLRIDRVSEDDESQEDRPQFENKRTQTENKRRKKKEYADADVPENLPDRFYDEDGEVNLSKATLKDAVKYMNAIGIKMPMPLPGKSQFGGRIESQEKPPSMDDLF